MVFQTSMLDWRRQGGGSICHRYICIVLYMKRIWMNVRMTQRFSVVVFHRSIGDMHVDLLLIGGCNGFTEMYAQLEGSICQI